MYGVAFAAGLLVGACGSAEPPQRKVTSAPPPAVAAVVADAAIVASASAPTPTARLPDGVTPLAYDLRLEVNPTEVAFRGHVAIRVRLDAPTRVIWLHAKDLVFVESKYAGGTITRLRAGPHDLHGLELPRSEGPGEITIELSYTGRADKDQKGLFRQKGFLFSQAEAALARRFVPSFDEPRFKTPWRITLVVPKTDVALANAPIAKETALPDGRREVVFEEIAALPTYLVAIAVGPFALVDGGRVGRNKVPLRIVVPKGAERRAAYAVKMTSTIVEAIERYFDQPLPLAKLDLVSVPELFGAMEHPGLVTFASDILLGETRDGGFRRRFVRVCAHEIAHQWMGNLVTPAWWDDLWLSEAFATFLGDKAAAELGAFSDEALSMQIDRGEALAADAEPAPRALRRTIAAGDDIDDTFDAIAYEKGRAVLVMFERYVGADVFRTALRAYVNAHARGNATTADFAAALASASSPEVGRALVSLAEHAGTPIVELRLRCDAGPPAVVAHARDRLTVPVCIRYPASGGGGARACALVGERAELLLPATAACPSWVVGNDGGLGYFQVSGQVSAGTLPLSATTPGERLAFAVDIAGGVTRGELTPSVAATHVARLAATGDPYSELGALSIATAIEPLVGDGDRAAWGAWLARTFRKRLTVKALFGPRVYLDHAIRDALLAVVPGSALDRAVVTRARTILDRELAPGGDLDPGWIGITLAIAGHAGGKTLWTRLERAARSATDEDVLVAILEGATVLGPAFAQAIAETVLTGSLSSEYRVSALLELLGDPRTRDAAWTILRPKLPEILRSLEATDAKQLVDGLGATCSAPIRDDLATARSIDSSRARAAIDRCLAHRASAGLLVLP